MEHQYSNDWIDVRDDDGRLLFKWSPRLGVLEVRVTRAARGARHQTEFRQVPLSVFTPPTPPDPPLVDKIPLSVV